VLLFVYLILYQNEGGFIEKLLMKKEKPLAVCGLGKQFPLVFSFTS
jgi:hypothetical protein